MRHRPPLALTGLIVLLAACSGDPQPARQAAPPEATSGPTASAFEGVSWQRVLAGPPTTAPAVRFEDGRVQGFGGCNQFAGGYQLAGDRLLIEALAATMRACEPEVTAAESAFLAALGGAHQLRMDADRLTLVPVEQDLPPLVFEPVPPPSLGGVDWQVTGFNNGRQAVVSPLAGTVLQLTFADGTLAGQSGCNRFQAGYEQYGSSLKVEPPAATRMFCDGEGVMEQERQFLAALASATTWSIERGLLDMHRADGERVLTAIAAGGQ